MRHARKLALSTVCSIVLGGSALAADLPRPAPVYVSPPPPARVIYNWSGFYFGVNFGGGFSRQDTSLVTAGAGTTVATGNVSPTGIILGEQIGYNWQSGKLVFGAEADFQGSMQKDDATLAGGGASVSYTSRLRWFGTVRGRVGMAFDRLLPYVTAGWAYGRGGIDGTSTTVQFNAGQSYSGWTVGAGVEWAMLNQWSAKAEYLYIDFGNGPTSLAANGFNITSGKLTTHIARLGLNYHF